MLHLPATLPTPQVSAISSADDQQLQLVLKRPQGLGYNSGRFILRYDCGFRGIPIELEYRSVEISGSSDLVVRRSRSCFVVGEISRVTVWFVSGGDISIPHQVNVSDGEGEAWHIQSLYETTQMNTSSAYTTSTPKTKQIQALSS